MKKLLLLASLLLAVPAVAQQSVIVPATMVSTPLGIGVASTQVIVSGVTGKQIYVTAIDVVANGTGNLQFISGTGTACGTGTVNITGNYTLANQSRISSGVGNGAIWVIGSGLNLCAVATSPPGLLGSMSYAVF